MVALSDSGRVQTPCTHCAPAKINLDGGWANNEGLAAPRRCWSRTGFATGSGRNSPRCRFASVRSLLAPWLPVRRSRPPAWVTFENRGPFRATVAAFMPCLRAGNFRRLMPAGDDMAEGSTCLLPPAVLMSQPADVATGVGMFRRTVRPCCLAPDRAVPAMRRVYLEPMETLTPSVVAVNRLTSDIRHAPRVLGALI